MSASIATIRYGTGLHTLHCPGCGTAIMSDGEGLHEDLGTCPHIRFIHDWAGEPNYFGDETIRNAMTRCIEEAADRDESFDTTVQAIASQLPASALVLVSEPAQGADAYAIFVAFDLAAACGEW